jgi:hypothetical protein
MLHGPAKRRQMARSILPSRARKEARARLRLIHRAYRRRVAQRLDADRRRLGTVDVDELFDLGESTRSPDRAVREVVLDRRLADTLNHFERWAVQSPAAFRSRIACRAFVPGCLRGSSEPTPRATSALWRTSPLAARTLAAGGVHRPPHRGNPSASQHGSPCAERSSAVCTLT